MKLINLNGPQDVMALLVRRKWWILLPFVALSAAVLLITAILPKVYVSQSLVIVRPRDVPNDFVKDLIAGTSSERLSIITERVLSDRNLRNILVQFEDDLPEFRNLNLQDRIAKLRKQVDLQFSAGEQLNKSGPLPVSAFRILCQNHNPVTAQKIAKQLTDLFISEDRKNRESNVNETASFLQSQVDDLAARLAASDTKLKGLRGRRRNELPNQLESNLRRLENLQIDNQSLRRERISYVLAQAQLEQQISETPKRIPKPAGTQPKDRKVDEYGATLAEVRILKSQGGYTNNHPEVQRRNLQLKRLEESMTPEQIALAQKEDIPEIPTSTPATDTNSTQSNPSYLSMERSREFYKKRIEDIDEQTAQNLLEIKVYKEHVNNTPQGEQELTDVMRENDELYRQHLEMSSKLSSARLSESAENQQKGSQFEVVDPASLPLTPTKPVKSSILSAGFTLSLLISLAIAFVVDIANQKTWTQSDVTYLMGVKVLVEVPRIVTRDGAARTLQKRVGFLSSVGVGAIAYAVVLYFAYTHQSFVLHHLDPIIQRLY